MASKVMYQSNVHSSKGYAPLTGGESLKNKYKRAVKQVVDTLAPGFNPRRTKNRTGAEYSN